MLLNFQSIEFDKLSEQKAPLIPKLKTEDDLRYFPNLKDLKKKNVHDDEDGGEIDENAKENPFKDFTRGSFVMGVTIECFTERAVVVLICVLILVSSREER